MTAYGLMCLTDRSTATEIHGKLSTSERAVESKRSDEPKLTDDVTTQPDMDHDYLSPVSHYYLSPVAPALSASDYYETLNSTPSVSQSPRLQPADESDSNDYENDIDNLYITVLDDDS